MPYHSFNSLQCSARTDEVPLNETKRVEVSEYQCPGEESNLHELALTAF